MYSLMGFCVELKRTWHCCGAHESRLEQRSHRAVGGKTGGHVGMQKSVRQVLKCSFVGQSYIDV